MAFAGFLRNGSLPSISLLTPWKQARAMSSSSNSTFVLKRRWPAPLTKANKKSSLRQKHFIYDEIENNIDKPQRMLTILLTKYVQDIGQPGELVTVKEQTARFLMMTMQASYKSKENLKKYADLLQQPKTFSSKYVAGTLKQLEEFILNISMNKEIPWTLEPWHVRASFRKAGVCVPESCITMPQQTISGPDLAIEGKEFFVRVTINRTEKVTVRCRIHHWATNYNDKVPRVRDHWKFPAETVFVEDKELAKTLPEIIAPVLEEDDFKPPGRIATRK